jgi:hypothetical protein
LILELFCCPNTDWGEPNGSDDDCPKAVKKYPYIN